MTNPSRHRKPEIMSPAGYWPQLQAAIEAGADAVYFGLKHFTARAKVGFTLAELPDVMRTLHQRGVKGYVTFNTLVFDHELEAAARTLAAIAETDADAIIVQDVGVAQLARQIAPDLEIHGSTQMSITSAEGIELSQRFGVSRVVLARELSLDEVRTIRAQTNCDLEVFVHGALCVSYSGQCFSSEAWGGRSANRGQCAQACRLPYDLIVDEQQRPLGDAHYLLSPGDLYALRQIPEIVQIGIAALKIEGRYKDANYVALTTHTYRQAVDEAWASLPLSISRREELHLEQVYSRGLGAHFIAGVNHQTVVSGRAPRHRGVLMGRIVQVHADRVVLMPDSAAAAAPLKAGDGVVFDAADWRSPEESEEGGRIYHVTPLRGGRLELEFGNGAINFARVRAGDLLWRTHDPELEKEARPFTQATAPVHKQPVDVRVTVRAGAPLLIEWTLVEQPEVQVTVQSADPLGPAQNRALSDEFLREQLGRLGNTPYELASLQLDLEGRPFAPSSLLNKLRRAAVEQLVERQGRPRSVAVNDPAVTLTSALAPTERDATPAATTAPQLHLLVRTPDQLAAALELQAASITLDYLDLYGLRPAVEQAQASGITARAASPRVLKPDEQRIVRFLLKLNCAIVVRSTGLLHALQGATQQPLIGDFSLNAANVLSADTFLRLGLTRLTPTHDLNAAQIADLSHSIGAERVEVVVYQHLPVFHTEHCVFCRFLSTGTSYKDCGHPCEKHRVALRDVNGRVHPVVADVGCRNTVFGAEAQEASRHLDTLLTTGIRHFRLEFVHETGADVTRIARAFADTLGGKLPSDELTRQLQRLAPQGTTEGSLFVPANYLTLPVLQ
ncbi:MAG: U32 family peptidase [Chloroflexales bacterium]|nr:U32 family peptidase [Chloroflexales bacterium]